MVLPLESDSKPELLPTSESVEESSIVAREELEYFCNLGCFEIVAFGGTCNLFYCTRSLIFCNTSEPVIALGVVLLYIVWHSQHHVLFDSEKLQAG